MSDKPKARLASAFSWVCDACGANNFASAIEVESATNEDMEQAVREAHGIPDWEPIPEGLGGTFLLAPERVKCGSCGEEFDTEEDDE